MDLVGLEHDSEIDAPLASDVGNAPIVQHSLSLFEADSVCSCLPQALCAIRQLSQSASDPFPLAWNARNAIKVAKVILHCGICYNFDDPCVRTCHNVLLLAHLLSSIAFCCSEAWKLALDKTTDQHVAPQEQITFVDGRNVPPLSDFQTLLSPSERAQAIRMCLQNDTHALNELCEEFDSRQVRRHMHNHEFCGISNTCIALSNLSGTTREECPGREDVRSRYPCFRSVEQAKAALKSLRTHILRSQKS